MCGRFRQPIWACLVLLVALTVRQPSWERLIWCSAFGSPFGRASFFSSENLSQRFPIFWILFRNRRPRFGLSGLGHVKSPVIAIVFLKSAVLSKRIDSTDFGHGESDKTIHKRHIIWIANLNWRSRWICRLANHLRRPLTHRGSQDAFIS